MSSQLLVDAVLVVLAVEVLIVGALVVRRRRSWRLLPTLASGLALAVGLRLAVAGASSLAIGAALLAAGAAHAVDLVVRSR